MQHGMLVVILLTLMAAGCARQSGPDLRDALPGSSDGGPGGASAIAAPIDSSRLDDWCHAYLPPTLQDYTQRALRNNRELASAGANLREADALARAAGAARWPRMAVEGSASSSRQPFTGDLPAGFPGDLEATTQRYRLGLQAQYELDLWGRLSSEAEAAVLEAEASAADLRTARVSIAAEVAERWFELLAQNRLTELLEAEVAASERMLKLVKLRFSQGQTQGLDIVQQRQQTVSIEGQLALARAEARAVSRELATLLGESPDSAPAPLKAAAKPEPGAPLPQPPALPLEGIPANLLSLRPDLAAAGQRMAAADQQAAAAVAERLPGVQLSADIFSQAANVSNLFGAIFWNLLGSVSLVVLDGGRLEAQADAADARAEAALEQFAQTYLTALTEVGTALILEDGQRAQLISLQEQTAAAEQALELARSSYLRGIVDYLRVLSVQQSLLQSRQGLIQGRRQLLGYRVQTCRALGFAPQMTVP